MDVLLLGAIFGIAICIALVAAGCGDDKWKLIAHCSTGQVQHVNDELICYRHDGSAFKFRAWQEGDEDPAVACGFCGGVPQ